VCWGMKWVQMRTLALIVMSRVTTINVYAKGGFPSSLLSACRSVWFVVWVCSPPVFDNLLPCSTITIPKTLRRFSTTCLITESERRDVTERWGVLPYKSSTVPVGEPTRLIPLFLVHNKHNAMPLLLSQEANHSSLTLLFYKI
jgi:hypothetical protein